MESDLAAKLCSSDLGYSIFNFFFEPNDPSRDMPSGPIKFVITPSQEGLTRIIFDQ
jgi:hypothetical protein